MKVHLSQSGFAFHLVEENDIHLRNITPHATPYRSGLLIDACPESDEDETSPTFIERKRKHQSIVGSIGWLAQTTRPDLAPSHSFLSAYSNKPSRSHLNAALYILHYIHLTFDYGFTFSLEEKAPLHTYMTFPHLSDTEAYDDALPPRPEHHHHLTTYSDACWGSQIGNAIRKGIQLPLFKFRSMSGAIIFRSGGPITWKTERQDRTSLSLCETEICATNMGFRLTPNLRNMILHLQFLGYPINDTDIATPLYNDNDACVKWCHNLTSKSNRHIEHRENSTSEWVDDGALAVSHVSGKCNPSDIFTKKMRNGCKLPTTSGFIDVLRFQISQATLYISPSNDDFTHLTYAPSFSHGNALGDITLDNSTDNDDDDTPSPPTSTNNPPHHALSIARPNTQHTSPTAMDISKIYTQNAHGLWCQARDRDGNIINNCERDTTKLEHLIHRMRTDDIDDWLIQETWLEEDDFDTVIGGYNVFRHNSPIDSTGRNHLFRGVAIVHSPRYYLVW